MVVFPEAQARLFKNIYVCRKCERKVRVPIGKVLVGKGVCRKCGFKTIRPIRMRAKN